MKIRNVTPNDEVETVALWQVCGLTAPNNDLQADFRFALSKAASDILVAEDEAIIGSVMVGHDGHRGWLYYVAVAPASRGRGIGRALVEAAESWLRRHGVVKVQLMVRETNDSVAAFYRRLGYDPMPRINMQKWLKP
jgi:ribosomal protein S18 acetylase RimI-like enzyme